MPTLEEHFSTSLLDNDTPLVFSDATGGRSKSVLFCGCKLANELMKFEDERKWVIMSKVWVELLSYATSHCGPSKLVASLSKGGQLITLVWLLMTYFGINSNKVRAYNFNNNSK